MQPWYALQVSREGFLNHGMHPPPLGNISEPVGLLSEGVLGVVGPMPSTPSANRWSPVGKGNARWGGVPVEKNRVNPEWFPTSHPQWPGTA